MFSLNLVLAPYITQDQASHCCCIPSTIPSIVPAVRPRGSMLISVDVEIARCFTGHSQATAEPAQSHQRKELRARGNSSPTSACPWSCSKCECGRQDSRKSGSSGKRPYSCSCSQDRRLKLVVKRSPALAWESASCLCMVQLQLQAAAGEKAGSCW